MQVTVLAIHVEVLKFMRFQSSFYKGSKPTIYLNRNGTHFSAAHILTAVPQMTSLHKALSIQYLI